MASSTETPNSRESNIVQWALSGQYNPDIPVLVDVADLSRTVSKNKAIELLAKLTGAFQEDSTVCLHLANDVLYPILMLAIFCSKCRWTGTNIAYTSSELAHHFRTSETKYVITAEDHLETVRSAVNDSGTAAQIIIFSDILFHRDIAEQEYNGYGPTRQRAQTAAFPNLHDCLTYRKPEALYQAIDKIGVDSIATLMNTSGTTGFPKMAAHTHRAAVIESAATSDNHNQKPYKVRRLFCTPIFHSFSTPEMAINSIRLGFPSFFMKRFDENAFPAAIKQWKITETFAPPPMLLKLVENPACHANLRSLRNIYTGGAPLVPELKARFDAIFPSDAPRIAQVWGMTEGGWFTNFKYPEIDDTCSVGRILPNWEIRQTENHSTTTFKGHKAGELQVRGPSLMSCYFNNPSATASSFEDGWLKTGDIGYICPSTGKIYLVDRAKDLIKVNGWQVAPAELEDAFMKCEGVTDVGVIGVGQDVEEHPLAFVVRAGEGVSAEGIKTHLRALLTRYKVSATEICFVEAIPKNVSGKILKGRLREMAEEMRG